MSWWVSEIDNPMLAKKMQYILTLHAESRLSLSGISTSTPPFFLLLSAFQPHLQTPKWFWQLEECTNTTARTFEVITNRVYYYNYLAGHSNVGAYFQWQCRGLQCGRWLWWKCLLQYLWTLMSKKTLSPRELASHRLPAAFKFGQKKPLNSSVLTVECGQAS